MKAHIKAKIETVPMSTKSRRLVSILTSGDPDTFFSRQIFSKKMSFRYFDHNFFLKKDNQFLREDSESSWKDASKELSLKPIAISRDQLFPSDISTTWKPTNLLPTGQCCGKSALFKLAPENFDRLLLYSKTVFPVIFRHLGHVVPPWQETRF